MPTKISTNEINNASCIIAVFSQPGAGKTTLARTLRQCGRVALIDTEGGTDVLRGVDGIDIYSPEVEQWKSCNRFHNELRATLKMAYDDKPGSIVVDTMSAIQDKYIDICKRDELLVVEDYGTLSQAGWGMVNDATLKDVKMFETASREVPIVLLCHEVKERDELLGSVLRMVSLRDKGGGRYLNQNSAAVLRLAVRGTGERSLECEPSATVFVKSRKPPGTDMPAVLDVGSFEEPGNALSTVVQKLKGKG